MGREGWVCMCLSRIVCMGKPDLFTWHRGMTMGGALLSWAVLNDKYILKAGLPYRALGSAKAKPILLHDQVVVGDVPLSLCRLFTAQVKYWCPGSGCRHKLELGCCTDCRVWVSSLGPISFLDSWDLSLCWAFSVSLPGKSSRCTISLLLQGCSLLGGL